MITVTFVWVCEGCTPWNGTRYPGPDYIRSTTEEASPHEDYMPGLPDGWTYEGEGDEYLLRCPQCSEGRGGAAVVVQPAPISPEDSYAEKVAQVGGE